MSTYRFWQAYPHKYIIHVSLFDEKCWINIDLQNKNVVGQTCIFFSNCKIMFAKGMTIYVMVVMKFAHSFIWFCRLYSILLATFPLISSLLSILFSNQIAL